MSELQTYFPGDKAVAGIQLINKPGFVADGFLEEGEILIRVALRKSAEAKRTVLESGLQNISNNGIRSGGISSTRIKRESSAIISSDEKSTASEKISRFFAYLVDKEIITAQERVKAEYDLGFSPHLVESDRKWGSQIARSRAENSAPAIAAL